jgi:hypothetical protein
MPTLAVVVATRSVEFMKVMAGMRLPGGTSRIAGMTDIGRPSGSVCWRNFWSAVAQGRQRQGARRALDVVVAAGEEGRVVQEDRPEDVIQLERAAAAHAAADGGEGAQVVVDERLPVDAQHHAVGVGLVWV